MFNQFPKLAFAIGLLAVGAVELPLLVAHRAAAQTSSLADAYATIESKRFVDLGLPRSSIVVAVDRKGVDMLIPNGDTTLQPGDAVILMVKKESRDDVRGVLVGVKTPA